MKNQAVQTKSIHAVINQQNTINAVAETETLGRLPLFKFHAADKKSVASKNLFKRIRKQQNKCTINKKHSYRRETALASKQGKGKTVGSRTVGGSEKTNLLRMCLSCCWKFLCPSFPSRQYSLNYAASMKALFHVTCKTISSINKFNTCSF
jgi:hypothetical protein